MSLHALELACTRGDRQLFSAINFEVQAGDALRVAGTNGSGKTSLLRLLCGLAVPAHGEVLWHGQNIRSQREEFASQLSYLGHAHGVKDELIAWENLVIASTLSGAPVGRAQACLALEEFGLEHAAELPTRALSQGQRKRVALARLQIQLHIRLQQNRRGSLWILDEPFTALDQAALAQLCATINRHLASGGMLIYTTHQEIPLAAQRLLSLDLDQAGLC